MFPKVEILRIREDNYCYLLYDRDARHVAVIDPGVAEPVERHLQQLGVRPAEIWLTHKHADHIGGAGELARRFDIPVRAPAEIPALGVRCLIVPGNGHFLFGAAEVTVRTVPGHTRQHVVYALDGVIFTGDTLFIGGCGRIFEGTAEELHAGIQSHIAPLPDHTRVYCGHEYAEPNLRFAMQLEPGNQNVMMQYSHVRGRRAEGQPSVPGDLGIEKKTNPFLRCDDARLRRAVELQVGRPLAPDPAGIFRELRDLRDRFHG